MIAAKPPGFYKMFPEVTWDLAQERWLGTCARSDYLFAHCLSCDWEELSEDPVLAKPERRQVAMLLAVCQHWYDCPADPPADRVEFEWFMDVYGSWSDDLRRWIEGRWGDGPAPLET